jgi:hypothetical protein
MKFIKTNLVFILAFAVLLILSYCKQPINHKNETQKIAINLDSVQMIRSKDDNSGKIITTILYYYFTCTNLYPDSSVNIQIEKFKDYLPTKDSLIAYFDDKPFKLYTSFRSNDYNIKYSVPYSFKVSPEPNELLTFLQKTPYKNQAQELENFINNAQIILYISNSGIINQIHINKGNQFKISTIESLDPWF